MGIILEALVTITAAPIVLTASFMSLLVPQRKPDQGKRNRSRQSDRGRLVLIAVDETSFHAVDYATREFLVPDDFVHLLHIIEFDERMEYNVKPFRFTSVDSPNVQQIKGLQDILGVLSQSRVKFDGRVEAPSEKESLSDVILRINREVEPDLLIIGASERTGSQDLGTVASKVAMMASSSVLLVK